MSIISDKTEQSNLRQSGRILASCLIHLGNMIKPGMSASKLNSFAIDFIKKNGGTTPFLGYGGFPHALCTSINNEVVHGLSNEEKIIKIGDVVSLDLGVDFKGMITDSARSFLVGSDGSLGLSSVYEQYSKPEISKQLFSANHETASDETKMKLLVRSQESLSRAIAVIKAGCRVGDIGFAISDYVNIFGYGNVSALGGHGVGRAVHEPPYIAHTGKKGTGSLLVENKVIAVEPMITLGGGNVKFVNNKKYNWEEVLTADYSLAAHFEDTILITKKGCEVMTRISVQDLIPVS
jgi:methionyl aminopeptidase